MKSSTSLHRGPRAGHTLVEMIVVTTLLALVTMLAAKAWAPLGKGTFGMRDRVVASTELRVAMEFLRRDLGAAKKVVWTSDGTLLIERETAAATLAGYPPPRKDPGIHYRLKDDLLLRRETISVGEIVVARSLSDFDLSRHKKGGLLIRLAAGKGEDAKDLSLVYTGSNQGGS